MDQKVLIAYYSHSGNTRAVAEQIKTITGGDIFEITPRVPYPKDYATCVSQVKKEKGVSWYRPELLNNGDVSDYDVVFIGTPVWWYTIATPLATFIENNNFENKIIVPFCTHGGGGVAETFNDIEKFAKPKQITKGLEIFRKAVTEEELKSWIEGLNL